MQSWAKGQKMFVTNVDGEEREFYHDSSKSTTHDIKRVISLYDKTIMVNKLLMVELAEYLARKYQKKDWQGEEEGGNGRKED